MELQPCVRSLNRAWMIGSALSSMFLGATFFRRSARTRPRAKTTRVGRNAGQQTGPARSGRVPTRRARTERRSDRHRRSLRQPRDQHRRRVILKAGLPGSTQNVHVTPERPDMDIPFVRTFSDVDLKKPLLYIDSRGHLALAVNLKGSFVAEYSIQPPVSIFFPLAKKLASSRRPRTSSQNFESRGGDWGDPSTSFAILGSTARNRATKSAFTPLAGSQALRCG